MKTILWLVSGLSLSLILPKFNCTAATRVETQRSFMPSSSVLDASFIRQLSVTTDACQEDMAPLESDSGLDQSLQLSIDTFNDNFESNLRKYCAAVSHGNGYVSISCIVDYEEYTTGYQNTCKKSNGMYHPVSFLMQCSDENIDVEMEVMNVPSCVGHSCDLDAVYTAIAHVLDTTDVTVLLSGLSSSTTTTAPNIAATRDDRPLSCHIFHNIGIPDAPEEGLPKWKTALSASMISVGSALLLVGLFYVKKYRISFTRSEDDEHAEFFHHSRYQMDDVYIEKKTIMSSLL